MNINTKTFIESPEVRTAYEKHSTAQKILSSLNIFTLVSNTFYKENFHSDVLLALLKEDRDLFTNFIDLLNSQGKKSTSIDIKKYNQENLLIEREKGNIDLLIRDEVSKHAIIIENKINNAVDQYLQLPKYYNYVTSKLECTVDAIVYLSFDGVKHPATNGWNEKDKKNVFNRLIKLPAFDSNDENYSLYSWLLSYSQIGNTELSYLTKQYGELLKQLAQKYKREFSAMDEFYKILTSKCDTYDPYEIVQEVTKMYHKLPAFYAKRTWDHFSAKYEPFGAVNIHKVNTMFFDKLFIGSSNYAIDVILNGEKVEIKMFDRFDNNEIESLIYELELDLTESSSESGRYIKTYKFPEEESKVYPFIENILTALRK